MSTSIYYMAKRPVPLSVHEQSIVDKLVAAYSIRGELEARTRGASDFNGEDFCVYDRTAPTEPGVIFEGATKLPDETEESIWNVVRHWAELLTEIRRKIPDASWSVNIDDHDLFWDEAKQEYDPSV